jgi:hypothetical protein
MLSAWGFAGSSSPPVISEIGDSFRQAVLFGSMLVRRRVHRAVAPRLPGDGVARRHRPWRRSAGRAVRGPAFAGSNPAGIQFVEQGITSGPA